MAAVFYDDNDGDETESLRVAFIGFLCSSAPSFRRLVFSPDSASKRRVVVEVGENDVIGSIPLSRSREIKSGLHGV